MPPHSMKNNVLAWARHAYSFHYETAISGIRAFEQYQSKPIQPFFVFQESGDRIFACSGERWPDLRALDDDIYVFPRTMEWTFVTTHEMSIGLGPYFALAPTESIAMPSTEAP